MACKDSGIKIYEFLFTVGSLTGCHQLPQRSFFVKGRQFPLCARCTGVLIGQAISVSLALCKVILPIWAAVLGMLVMLIDWVLQYFSIWTSCNVRRLVTGVLGGLGYAGLLVRAWCMAVDCIKNINWF